MIVSYGSTTPPLAAAGSGQSAVGSAELIDAAMALEWLGRAESEQTERIAGSIFSETASATDQETQKYAPVVSTTNASETPSIDADTPSIVAGESAEQSWLAEELLEHVFG